MSADADFEAGSAPPVTHFCETLTRYLRPGSRAVPHGPLNLGYEGKNGVHVVQANTANPREIQHIGASELGRFGSCCWITRVKTAKE